MPPPPLSSTANHPIIRSQTKVETQNLASPVPSMPTYACYNTLTTNAFLPCRDAKSCVSRPTPCRHTQAIIRWQHTHFSLVRRKILRLYMLPPSLSSTANISYYTQSNQSRDAKSCVSRPVPYQHAQAIIRWQHTHFSLVRRKILRLYKAGALNMHAYIPHIR